MKQCIRGLTLIEVMIALAIIAIALTAVIKAASQTIRGTDYLQKKTIALWVAEQALNEARVGILPISSSHTLKQKTKMFGADWHWQATQESTPNKRIKKLKIAVYERQEHEEGDAPLVSLEGYVYREK